MLSENKAYDSMVYHTARFWIAPDARFAKLLKLRSFNDYARTNRRGCQQNRTKAVAGRPRRIAVRIRRARFVRAAGHGERTRKGIFDEGAGLGFESAQVRFACAHHQLRGIERLRRWRIFERSAAISHSVSSPMPSWLSGSRATRIGS